MAGDSHGTTWRVGKVRRETIKIERWTRKYDRSTGTFKINIRYKCKTEVTPRTIGVAEAFGIGVDDYTEHVIYDDLTLKIGPKDIVYITGDSGSGKSVLLRAMEKDLGNKAININKISVDPDKPIIETVGRTFDEALMLLSRVGLNDAYLFLRRYHELSDGQKYRYKLAKLMESDKQWWLMDEFCSTLDRDTAKIVAYNVQKQARRMGKAIIASTTHTDLFEDLKPSVHIHKGWGKRIQVKYYPNKLNKVCSITRQMRIEEASLSDYKQLAEFHYRNPKTYPPPLKIFKLTRGDELAGVIFYAPSPPNIYGRTKFFGRQLSIREVNEKLATISRVIIHPKYRSIGLGVKLVSETLPLVGKPYIETMAVMAKYNPFFEKAGMKRVAVRKLDKSIMKAVEGLERLGFKRYLLASREANKARLNQLSREGVEDVKAILVSVSPAYYKRLRSTKRIYPKRGEYRAWLEKADNETLAKVIARLAVLAQEKVYLIWKK